MNVGNVGSVPGNGCQYVNRTQKTATGKTDFTGSLQGAAKSGAEKADAYKKYLEAKYGAAVIENVEKDQKSIDRIGSATWGTGNVVIAPDILEQMANNPEKAAYYEEKIQNYFNSVPRCKAELSAMGHELHSSGIIIHPDGSVTHYISGDLKPEVRARIEAKVKEEQEEKAKRKRQYQELGKEAAEKQRLLMEQYMQSQSAAYNPHQITLCFTGLLSR